MFRSAADSQAEPQKNVFPRSLLESFLILVLAGALGGSPVLAGSGAADLSKPSSAVASARLEVSEPHLPDSILTGDPEPPPEEDPDVDQVDPDPLVFDPLGLGALIERLRGLPGLR